MKDFLEILFLVVTQGPRVASNRLACTLGYSQCVDCGGTGYRNVEVFEKIPTEELTFEEGKPFSSYRFVGMKRERCSCCVFYG